MKWKHAGRSFVSMWAVRLRLYSMLTRDVCGCRAKREDAGCCGSARGTCNLGGHAGGNCCARRLPIRHGLGDATESFEESGRFQSDARNGVTHTHAVRVTQNPLSTPAPDRRHPRRAPAAPNSPTAPSRRSLSDDDFQHKCALRICCVVFDKCVDSLHNAMHSIS